LPSQPRPRLVAQKQGYEIDGDSGPCRSVFRDMPITGSGVMAIMIPG
jgi:hypothetical protein